MRLDRIAAALLAITLLGLACADTEVDSGPGEGPAATANGEAEIVFPPRQPPEAAALPPDLRELIANTSPPPKDGGGDKAAMNTVNVASATGAPPRTDEGDWARYEGVQGKEEARLEVEPGADIVIALDHDVIAGSAVGTNPPEPTRLLTMYPNIEGELTWRDRRTLVLAPSAPLPRGQSWFVRLNALPLNGAGTRLVESFAWTFETPPDPAAERAEARKIGNKVFSWAPEAGKPRMIGYEPGYGRSLGPGEHVQLIFDQPVDPAALARSIELLLVGEPAVAPDAGVSWRYAEFSIRALGAVTLDGVEFPAGHVVELVPTTPLKEGQQIQAKVFTDLLPKDWAWPWWLPFRRASPLELTGMTCSTTRSTWSRVPCVQADGRAIRVGLDAEVSLDFNNAITPESLEAALTISPAPVEPVESRVYRSTAELRMTLEPGKRYDLRLRPGVADRHGYRLAKGAHVVMEVQDQSPNFEISERRGVIEATGPRTLPVALRNVSTLDVKASLVTPDALVERIRSGEVDNDAHMEIVHPEVPRNKNVAFAVELDRFLEGKPGVLVYEIKPRSLEGDFLRTVSGHLQVTDLGITTRQVNGEALVWVTRLSTGRPVPGAAVQLLDASGEVAYDTKTDGDGVATIDALPSSAPVFVTAREGVDLAFVELRRYGNASGLPSTAGLIHDRREVDVHVDGFAERGVYRPGETMHLEVVARRRGEGGLTPLQGREVTLRLVDSRNKQAARRAVTLDAFGTAHAAFDLPAGANLGAWRWEATVGDGGTSTSGRFLVEHYKPPRFEVGLSAPEQSSAERRGIHVDDGPAEVALDGRYYAGGAMVGAQVNWLVERRIARLSVADHVGFSFGDNGAASASTASEGTTGEDGRATLALPMDTGEASGPWYYRVSAEVQDVDRRAVSTSRAFIVHDRDTYLGVKVPRGIVVAKAPIKPLIIGMDDRMELRPGVATTVTLLREDYHHVARRGPGGSWSNVGDYVYEEVDSCRTRTARRPVGCRLTPPKAGSYQVVIEGVDRKGRKLRAVDHIYVYGEDYVPWRPSRAPTERLELVTDKDTHRVGEDARVLIKSPWPGGTALVTVEDGEFLSRRVIPVRGSAQLVEVPIEASMAPGVRVHVSVARGRRGRLYDGEGWDRGTPTAVSGSLYLPVDARDTRLAVEVTPKGGEARPGEEITVEVAVEDGDGQPLAPGEGAVTLWLVDDAILELTSYQTPDVHRGIYARRYWSDRTQDSRDDLLASRSAWFGRTDFGGDGGSDDGVFGPEGSKPARRERLRDDFRPTAAFLHGLQVGEGGVARATVTLPDGLTRYRVMASVVDRGGRFGRGEGAVTVNKPLMVQPSLPRLLRTGDRFELAATVFNQTDAPLSVTVGADAPELSQPGPAERVVDVAPGRAVEVRFPAEAPDAPVQAEVIFSARATGPDGELSDHERRPLSVTRPGDFEGAGTSGSTRDDLLVKLDFPEGTFAEGGTFDVTVSTTLLSELSGSMDYLVRYPYGCVEQTTSSTWPLLSMRGRLRELGLDTDPAELDKMIRSGVQRLLTMATPSGGLGYWPGRREPHFFGTAYALIALTEADRAGFDVPEPVVERAALWLERNLSTATAGEAPSADEDISRTMSLYSLARAGRPQASFMSIYVDDADRLPTTALGLLGLALVEAEAEEDQRQRVAEALMGRFSAAEAGLTLNREEPPARYAFGSDARTWAIAAGALTRLLPGEPMAELLLRGLLAKREGGRWRSTQSNVWGLFAAATWANEVEAAQGEPDFAIRLGDTVVAPEPSEDGALIAALSLPMSQVLPQERMVLENLKGHRLFYTIRSRYQRDAGDGGLPPAAHTLAVFRRYESPEGEVYDGQIPAGAVVRVRLMVHVPETTHWVALNDPMPAGFEPINLRFSTNSGVSATVNGEEGRFTRRGLRMGAWYFNHHEQRDDRVLYFADTLYSGLYELTYLARATTPGDFAAPPPKVEAMYDPTHWARGLPRRVEVR